MTGGRAWNPRGRAPGDRTRRALLLLVVPMVASLAMTWSVLPAHAVPSAGQSATTDLESDADTEPGTPSDLESGVDPDLDPDTPGTTVPEDPEVTEPTLEAERRGPRRSVIKIATY